VREVTRVKLRAGIACSVLILLAACSGETPPPEIRDYGQIGGASGNELADDQTLRKDNGAEPQTLDPHRATGVPEGNILRDLFEPLVMERPDGELMPGAA
jgi:oligopeptide transport system substrate-binding protein